MRQVLVKLGLATASLLIFVGGVEIVLALLGLPRTESDPTFHELVHQIDAQELFYDTDPDLFWVLRPGLDVVGERTRFRTNSLGLRGPEPVRSGGDRPLVLFLGDSVTFGYGLSWDETFPELVRKRLAQQGLHVDVVNAGIPGYTAFQGRRQWRRLSKRLRPDLVVVSYGFNDAREMFASDLDVHRAGARLLGVRALLHERRFYRLMRGLLASPPWARAGGAPVARLGPADYATTLEGLLADIRATGAQGIVLGTPFQTETLTPYGPTWFTLRTPVSGYRDLAARIAEREGVPFVRIPELCEADPTTNGEWFLDPAHPNAAGNGFIAARLAGPIARALASPPPARHAGG